MRVIGHLRAFVNERSLIAFRVIPITDFNEVTFHLLEVMQVHLHNTQPSPVSNNNNNNMNGGYVVPRKFSSHMGLTLCFLCRGQNFSFVGGNTADGGQLSDLNRGILNVLRDAPSLHSQEGVPAQYLY